MPNWSKSDYSAYQARNLRAGPRPQHEEQQDVDTRKADNKAGIPSLDEKGSGLYRCTISLRVSDNRDRDADGAVTTILDTILNAVGRFLDMDRNTLRKLAKSEQRRRGSGDNY